METWPIARDLVLVGGGHSHVILLRMLAMHRVPGLQVTLVSPDVETAYSGMLPGVVAGHYRADDIHIDLGKLCRFAGARFIRVRVAGIDPVAHRIDCEGRPDLHYDVASLDIGITPELRSIAGAAENGIAVKPIGEFMDKWQAFLARARRGEVKSVGVVGAGAGGVELCLAIAHRLVHEVPGRGFDLHLVSDKSTLLAGYPARVQARFMKSLAAYNVRLHTEFRANRYEGGKLADTDGETLAVDAAFFVTRAGAHDWLAGTGLPLDENGFIKVRETLQVAGFDDIFAVGDIAHVLAHPRPKAGVFAVRQGPPLYRNILRVLHGKPAKPFRPQREFLSLITTGERRAVASKYNLSAEGRWVWYWKDWIDRKFMRRFKRLPVMAPPVFTGLLKDFDAQMHCGGCGAKVSADLLRDVLQELGVDRGNLDDAAEAEVPPGQVMLHTVDAFRAFVDDPWVFARIAVNHALGDIYAMGATPVNALAIMTLPYATPGKTRDLLAQLMRGALQQLGNDEVALVGGHTSEGMELSLGFAVNGTGEPARLWHKSGLSGGDKLVLTKPIGTGALFAADMQARAPGSWIQAALAGMLVSNREAARCLATMSVHAATDVTGFGLAGHLREMLVASGQGARLHMSDLPVLPGALEMISQGITSTLHEGNRQATPVPFDSHPNFELLFDPQTAGGLLLGIAAEHADAAVAALKHAGYAGSAIIGEVIDAEPGSIVFR